MLKRLIDRIYRLSAWLFRQMSRAAVLSLAYMAFLAALATTLPEFDLDALGTSLGSGLGDIVSTIVLLLDVFLLGIIPFLLPFCVVAFFVMALVAGRDFEVTDLWFGLAGFAVTALVVVVAFRQATCPDPAAGANLACTGRGLMFVFDQSSKGMFGDVFDIFDLKLAPFDISLFTSTGKMQLLAFRVFSQAMLFMLIALIIERVQADSEATRTATRGREKARRVFAWLQGWVSDVFRGLSYNSAMFFGLLAVFLAVEAAGWPILTDWPFTLNFLSVLGAMLALTLPYAALAFFVMAIITGRPPQRGDIAAGFAGLGICTLAVVILVEQHYCAATGQAAALPACSEMATGFALDQFNKGALGDILDIYGLKFAGNWSVSDFSTLEKLAVLSLRMFSEVTALTLAGALIARLRRIGGAPAAA